VLLVESNAMPTPAETPVATELVAAAAAGLKSKTLTTRAKPILRCFMIVLLRGDPTGEAFPDLTKRR
jgi:hypothetical protein